MSWRKTEANGSPQLQVAYRDSLEGKGLRLRYGFDGWKQPIREVTLEKIDEEFAVTEPLSDLAGHVSLECAVTDGER
jgi:hypothetical protein